MSKLTLGHQPEGAQAGRRDAFHVPAVLINDAWGLEPGMIVTFKDEKLMEVEKWSEGMTPHGVVDPTFMGELEGHKQVWILLLPGMTSNLVHHFDVHLPEKTDLEKELEKMKHEDGDCSSCYVIKDGAIVRY